MPEGQLIAPGFLDGHIHIESSMMTPIEYAKAVIPHGTVGIYYDPHEVCKCLALKALILMGGRGGKDSAEGYADDSLLRSGCSGI